MERHHLQFDVAYPERLNRLLIFVKWILILPQRLIVGLLTSAVVFITFVAWFAVLFAGRYPAELWAFSASVLAWNARISVYSSLLRDEYPPFSLDAETYPVRFELPYPDRLSRLGIFVAWLLIVPHFVALIAVGLAAAGVSIVAAFTILFTGRYPRSLFDFRVGYLRWRFRVLAHVWMLTDAYPPFSLHGDRPTGTYIPPHMSTPAAARPAAYDRAFQAGPSGE